MPIELTADTNTGARLVAIAEELSTELAVRAAEHDRDGTYPFEAIEALKAAGYFAAPIPIELGGLGVSSAHDLVVASSRLARGDASVAIGVNMHLVAVQNMERRRQVAVAAGAERRARGYGASLDNGAEVTIAVVTFEADSGGAVCLRRIENQDERAKLNRRHALILELWFKLPNSDEPVERCPEVADTEVNVI